MRPLARGFWGHDTVWHLIRAAQWHRGVTEGVLFPRFLHDVYWGHGGPVMIFYSPVPYVVTEFFMLLGTGPVRALELGFGVGFVAGAAAMFLLARRPLGTAGAFVAAAAYTLAPYHLLDAWVRAAYAEHLALAVLPILLLAARSAVDRADGRGAAGLALATALIVLTHGLSAVFALPLAAAYGLWRLRSAASPGRGAALGRLATGLAVGLGLSAFYSAPAILERDSARVLEVFGAGFDPTRHLLWARQLLRTGWGFGWSGPGPDDTMSFQIGWVHLGALIAGALVAWRGARDLRAEVRFFLAAAAVSIYLTLGHSEWIWRVTPLLATIQYPWRLLGVVALSASLCAGSLMTITAGRSIALQTAAAAGAVALLVGACAPFTISQPRRYADKDFTPQALSESMSTESQWMPKGAFPPGHASPVLVLDGEAEVEVLEDRTHHLSARVQARTPASLRARIFAFPGWRAERDGVEVTTRKDPTGAIVVDVPEGAHEIRLTFGSTPLRTAAAWTSALCLALTAAGLLWKGAPTREGKSGGGTRVDLDRGAP